MDGPDEQLKALAIAAADGDQTIGKSFDHVGDPTLFHTGPGGRRRASGGFPRRARPQHQHGKAGTQDQTYHKPTEGWSRARRLKRLTVILNDFLVPTPRRNGP